MIDVTATMLPRTVINDRSLADQIASSAICAESRNLFINRAGRAGAAGRAGRLVRPIPPVPPFLPLFLCLHFHWIAIRHAADGVVRPGDYLVTGLEARQHLEVLIAGDTDLEIRRQRNK